jgi:hypothetical protein
MYASRAQLKGFYPTFKDDLESMLYLVSYLYNGFKLPWSDIGSMNG